MKTHQKHANLQRPALGNFGRNEWAIVGAPCGDIQHLVNSVSQALKDTFRIAYVDADHKGADEEATSDQKHDAYLAFTDKINYTRIDQNEKADHVFFSRPALNQAEVVLVNGNHFSAKRQIVIIDSRKSASLQKRIEQLTDIQLILLGNGEAAVFPFLQPLLEKKEKPVDVLRLDQPEEIAQWLLSAWQREIPKPWGLVLAGGKSERMGQDKGNIVYHQKPHREHLADLLSEHVEQVFISCRADQEALVDTAYPLLKDTFLGLGPFGAILSAFQAYPNQAWLVVACDLPLLDKTTIEALISARNPAAVATAFQSPVDDWPEPLVTIWEPKSYLNLFQFLAQGYSCPRKVLINSNCNIVKAPSPDALFNANFKEDQEAILRRLGNV